MIRLADVHKRFGAHEVLRGVSLAIADGRVHFVIGESGAGKTVLIKQVIGLLRPDRGSIAIDGLEVTTLDEAGLAGVRRHCQMIFQGATLLDWLTVLENVALPVRKRFAVSSREARARALAALTRVGAAALADRMPSELGLGLRKRAAIARAIALEPRVLLYDEPTTALDPVAARRTDRLVREMADVFGITSVVVSHDLRSVRDIGDRVAFVHQGRVRFDGTPAELWASADAPVTAFVRGERPRWQR